MFPYIINSDKENPIRNCVLYSSYFGHNSLLTGPTLGLIEIIAMFQECMKQLSSSQYSIQT